MIVKVFQKNKNGNIEFTKEEYFISLYQADTYGYNGNIGVNKK